MEANRRRFIKKTLATAAGLGILTGAIEGKDLLSRRPVVYRESDPVKTFDKPVIRFAAIGLNHGHIYSQVNTVIRSGGELVWFYAKEPDLIATFQERFPQAKLARSEDEILQDPSIQLVVSASIPIDRAPLGIRVMQHGKDFMADKPGIITLKQLK